jgi:hypothetical protein
MTKGFLDSIRNEDVEYMTTNWKDQVREDT